VDPNERPPDVDATVVHLLDVTLDGRSIASNKAAVLPPGDGRVQFRYTGINLTTPERVRYSYRLEGLDHDWVTSVARRVTNYNSLPHGRYRFVVRAGIPGGPSS
jgi:hypothetical protein